LQIGPKSLLQGPSIRGSKLLVQKAMCQPIKGHIITVQSQHIHSLTANSTNTFPFLSPKLTDQNPESSRTV
jgi:hypothetical protein